MITRSTANMSSEEALEDVLGNVLGYANNRQVRLAFSYFGNNDVKSFTMIKGNDFTLPYNIPYPEDAPN